MAVSVTSAATMQASLGRLRTSRPEINGHRHSPSPPWKQRREKEAEEEAEEEKDVGNRDLEEEEEEKKIPRRKKFSDARAFFERQERMAATCQLSSPTGSGPRAKRSRVNEMAKLFQVGRPIPVEEFVVDLDTALPDCSPEVEKKEFVQEKEEISRVDDKDGDGSSEDQGVDEERPKSPPGIDNGFESPLCIAKRTSSTGVATLASVSPQLPIVSPPTIPPPSSLPDSESETESARPPVEGQEDVSEETATFHTAKESLSQVSESLRTTVDEEMKDEEKEEDDGEERSAMEVAIPLKSILVRKGKNEGKEGVVKLVSSSGKAPISLPQPQHLTISSSTESLLDDDGDEYQDVPVTDTSDEETNDYERLTDCISNAPSIGVESFSGLLDDGSVPNIDDGVPEHLPPDSSSSVTVISSSEPIIVPRAQEVAVEKGVHYLEDGNFFYEMEPRSPSEDSDEDEALEMYSQFGPPVTPPHTYTKIRFSDDPITVFSTHSPSEYDRRNELIDPISANAEYELEKQLARMNVFPVRLNKGLRGLGIGIMGVGLGRAPGVEKLGIFIKAITPGGPADRDGQLKVLDQIVEVNGRSLVGVTQAEAAEVLRNTHGEVRFLIGREKPELKGSCTIVRLVEKSIQQQAVALRQEEEIQHNRTAPLAEVEDLRSPCDRSPSQPNKTFLPEERENGSPSFPSDLMARLRELESENSRMQMALDELHEKMALKDGVEANERLIALENRLSEVEHQEKEVRRERDSLERELKVKEKMALQKAEEGKERETLLQQQISNLKNDLESSQSRVSALRFENDELSIQLKEAEEKMDRITIEMNEKVQSLEGEVQRLRTRTLNHSPSQRSNDIDVISLDAADSSSILDVSMERHRATLVSSGSLAARRRPSKGRVVSEQNDEVLFGVPMMNGNEEDARGDEDGDSDEEEAMAEVFTSHGPDSTLSRGPRGGVPLLPSGGDILSMMRDKRPTFLRDQTSQELEDELINESKKNTFDTLDLGDVTEWSTDEVCSHFRNNGFAWLESYVRQNGVDGERLLALDSADMKSMGISNSTDRSKFKKKIKELTKAVSKQRAIL